MPGNALSADRFLERPRRSVQVGCGLIMVYSFPRLRGLYHLDGTRQAFGRLREQVGHAASASASKPSRI